LEALIKGDWVFIDIDIAGGRVAVLDLNTEFDKCRKALEAALPDIDFDLEATRFIPRITTEISGEDIKQMDKLVDALNDLDDRAARFP